ncbi:glycosyltransferase family 4 protein [Pedobacter sp. L105]|uniref:glycosyltransferase family 4 protein n=1 Tax=Pedobacter sp. L105 TaxID=1641871 RepID=UPI00131AB090|nr:glycosyltransferase family 4 protein [Pedobacter sp. L105]
MRITILINELNIRGGTHKQMHRLVEYLIRANHDVTIVTKQYDPDKCYPGIEKFNILSFDKYFKDYSKMNLLSKIYNKVVGSYKMSTAAVKDAECINIHDNGFGLISYFIKLKRKKLPVFWQINDLPPVFSLGNSKGEHGNWTYGLRKRFYIRMAKNVNQITVNVSKNALRVKEYLGVQAKVLHCGVDLRYTNFNGRTNSGEKIRLLSTGVFLAYRNYETFLDVQEKLSKMGYIVESAIIGSTALNPGYTEKISDLIKEKQLNCRITGDIPEKELIDIYNNSDYFLFLNIDQSWGLAVFEAMNFGLPTFVSQSVGAVELLNNDVDSMIVDPLDAEAIAIEIDHLQKNAAKHQLITRNAFDSTLKMTWDKMYSSKLEKIMIDETSCRKA